LVATRIEASSSMIEMTEGAGKTTLLRRKG
jgi:hypothetical protein